MYQHITLKELRPKLPKVIDSIDSRMERFIISKHGEPIAIMLSLDDYESLIETLNETSDTENLKNIRAGIKDAKEGRTVDWASVKKKYGF
jgi:antitoxin YefM